MPGSIICMPRAGDLKRRQKEQQREERERQEQAARAAALRELEAQQAEARRARAPNVSVHKPKTPRPKVERPKPRNILGITLPLEPQLFDTVPDLAETLGKQIQRKLSRRAVVLRTSPVLQEMRLIVDVSRILGEVEELSRKVLAENPLLEMHIAWFYLNFRSGRASVFVFADGNSIRGIDVIGPVEPTFNVYKMIANSSRRPLLDKKSSENPEYMGVARSMYSCVRNSMRVMGIELSVPIPETEQQ